MPESATLVQDEIGEFVEIEGPPTQMVAYTDPVREALAPYRTVKAKLLRPEAQLPQRMTEGSSGFDLFACIGPERGDSLYVGPEPVMVPTGIAVEVPAGYELQLRPRSSLAWLGVSHHYGTIDSDYRGELFVLLWTAPGRHHYVKHGDRIAQLVLAAVVPTQWAAVDALSPTGRGADGFGSTGR